MTARRCGPSRYTIQLMSDKTRTTPLVQPAPPIVGELVRRFGEHIDATDRRIDQLVYDLYGLTDDEIRIVEEATESSA